MSKTFHFISGLPRSGSTLLSALLLQNPRLYAGMASPLGPLYGMVSAQLSANNEVYGNISEAARHNVLRGLFDGYYADCSKPVIFDSGRYWTSKMAMIATLFPEARVICCVRPVENIVDSLERVLEKQPLEASGLFGFRGDGNVQSRLEHLRSSKGMIGSALNNIKQAFFGRFSDRLMLLQYSSLIRDPIGTLHEIYRFIGEEPFEHNAVDFEFSAEDVDTRLGAKGLHTVRGPIFVRDEEPLLPPDVIRACQALNFWLSSDIIRTKAHIW